MNTKAIYCTLKVDGTGFLRNVSETQEGIKVDIQVISGYFKKTEDVWMECFVPRKEADVFIQLQNRLLEGSYVMITIEGLYQGMQRYGLEEPQTHYDQLTVIKTLFVKLLDVRINGAEVYTKIV